jgi:hypothetical protein
MRLESKSMFSLDGPGTVPLISDRVPGLSVLTRCMSLLMFSLFAISLQAQAGGEDSPGFAWHVLGTWQVNGRGAPILPGDPIQPGSLLEPGERTARHSIVIYLPDGQRILYECFTAQDCARGFRVPSLYRKPEPMAADVVALIRAVLVRTNVDASAGSSANRSSLPRDEVMAVLGSGNHVEVEGLASKLPNGSYTGDLQPLDPAFPRQPHLVIEKTASSIAVSLPSAGLYTLKISDDLNHPRIDLFIAAVTPEQAPGFIKSYTDAKAFLKRCDGWPMHDFQRAYLESIISGARPMDAATKATPDAEAHGGNATGGGARNSAEQDRPSDVTAEPTFSPPPGVFDGTKSIVLRCDTPGAVLHYTIDSSQPLATSPIYAAPIILKGEGIAIIKAFASVEGKKDSPIVTGTFHIRH